MEREILEIITPNSNQKLKLKKYLTGRESRNITASLLDNVSYDDNQQPKFSAETMTKSQDATINEVVESIDDKTDNILDTILDMDARDFDFIIEEINKITGKGKEIKKE